MLTRDGLASQTICHSTQGVLAQAGTSYTRRASRDNSCLELTLFHSQLSANILDPPHHMEGAVDRLPLMWVKCAVCVGCVELLGWPLVLRDGSV